MGSTDPLRLDANVRESAIFGVGLYGYIVEWEN